MGFFADVGPLTVFVSHQVCSILDDCLSQRNHSCTIQLIHPDMKFDPASNPPSFASDDQVRASVSCSHSFLQSPLDHREEHQGSTKNRRYSC